MSKHYPHPILAREGWPFILCAVCVSVIASLIFGWLGALPLWIITVFVVQFFRDPARTIPQQANAVLSPADGRIVTVERCQDPQLKRDAIKVSVFMNVFNVHSACTRCNRQLSGNAVEYRIRLVNRIGLERVERLALRMIDLVELPDLQECRHLSASRA